MNNEGAAVRIVIMPTMAGQLELREFHLVDVTHANVRCEIFTSMPGQPDHKMSVRVTAFLYPVKIDMPQPPVFTFKDHTHFFGVGAPAYIRRVFDNGIPFDEHVNAVCMPVAGNGMNRVVWL